ncbi:hypothetical protein [Peribacillus sp. R9-11]|uniref:hypothetical protein n=1 Tax=Peribacillus sp. R9-11 TaxID=3073271 RepID=UPI002868D377|nr:hypothetical protein [Peribacillus sp. R9-11]WMX57445.1 hypothetical protein RE409_09600 [Peribacillus sp. R9-11]
MAKYKVLKKFQDIHTKMIYNEDTEIEMTVKRADEVSTNLDDSFLIRVEEKQEDPGTNKDDGKEEKQDKKMKIK